MRCLLNAFRHEKWRYVFKASERRSFGLNVARRTAQSETALDSSVHLLSREARDSSLFQSRGNGLRRRLDLGFSQCTGTDRLRYKCPDEQPVHVRRLVGTTDQAG